MKLRDLLKFNSIVIQCHDNPDADTIASGFALYLYLKEAGKDPRLVYAGKNIIHKCNLVLMVDRLNIPIEHVDHIDKPELLITVDCQYNEGNVTKLPGDNIAVIDHHIVVGSLPELNEVNLNLGSCSTLVWHMLNEEGFNVNANVALSTALYYGLYTDTGEFTEIYNPLDMDLRDGAKFDKDIINKFRNANLSLEELSIAGTALIGSDYIDEYRLAIVKAGPCDPNVLGIISDLVLTVDVIDICVVFCVQRHGVKFSVRSCVNEVKASELASEISLGLGSGGGHCYKAGGFIDLTLLNEAYMHYCEETEKTPRLQYNIEDNTRRTSDPAIKEFIKKRVVGYLKDTPMYHCESPEAADVSIKTVRGDLEAVIFDLDGTLLDTLLDLKNSVNYALSQNNMPKRTYEEVRKFVGNGIRNLMIRAVPNGEDNPLFEKCFADFKEHYAIHCMDNTAPYPGIMEMMRGLKLRNIKMGIVSNKIDSAVKELAEHFFKGYVDAAIGDMEGMAIKPAPDTVFKAAGEMQVDLKKAVYVGDSDVDIATAANAGLPCISVTWGFRDREFLTEHGARHFIDNPADLMKMI